MDYEEFETAWRRSALEFLPQLLASGTDPSQGVGAQRQLLGGRLDGRICDMSDEPMPAAPGGVRLHHWWWYRSAPWSVDSDYEYSGST